MFTVLHTIYYIHYTIYNIIYMYILLNGGLEIEQNIFSIFQILVIVFSLTGKQSNDDNN